MISQESVSFQTPVKDSSEQLIERKEIGTGRRGSKKYQILLGGIIIGRICGKPGNYHGLAASEYIGEGKHFNCLDRATDWLVDIYYSRYFVVKQQQLSKFLVCLKIKDTYKDITLETERYEIVETDPETICWANWLAYFNHVECEDFEIIYITEIN